MEEIFAAYRADFALGKKSGYRDVPDLFSNGGDVVMRVSEEPLTAAIAAKK